MIKPNHSNLHQWILNAYVNYIIATDFREVIITGDVKSDERSVLLVGNHFSWWDGFWGLYVNRKVFGKKFHVMMLERELSKRMFFTRTGAFSINQKSKGIIESINFCAEVLAMPGNLLLMFPQGRFESLHSASIKFHKGVARIASSSPKARIVFAACLTDYFAHRKPTLTIALQEYKGNPSLSDMEQAYNQHLTNAISQQENLFSK